MAWLITGLYFKEARLGQSMISPWFNQPFIKSWLVGEVEVYKLTFNLNNIVSLYIVN